MMEDLVMIVTDNTIAGEFSCLASDVDTSLEALNMPQGPRTMSLLSSMGIISDRSTECTRAAYDW